MLVLALVAAIAAAVRRARRPTGALGADRAATSQPALAAGPVPRLLEAGSDPGGDGHRETSGASGDSDHGSQAQVEHEIPPVEPGHGPRFVSLPWQPVPDPPPPATSTLRVRCALIDGEMELARVDVQETPSQVFVTVLARWERSPAGAPVRTREVEHAVELRAPLGDRALVHAPTDVRPEP